MVPALTRYLQMGTTSICMYINIDIFYRGSDKSIPVTMNYCISPTVIALTFRNFNDFKTRGAETAIGKSSRQEIILVDRMMSRLVRGFDIPGFSSSGIFMWLELILLFGKGIVSHVPNSPRQDGGLTRIATVHPNSRTSREGSNPTKTRTGTPRPSTANYDSRLCSWWWSSEVRWRRCGCGCC